jgi:hypothetical protein
MTFTISKPVFNSNDKSYKITINDYTPVIVCTNKPLELHFTSTEMKEYLNIFVNEFIQKASPYFSKPLEPQLFYARLSHTTNTDDYDSNPDTTMTYSVSWMPICVLFSPTVYKIEWRLISLEPFEEKYPGATVVPDDEEDKIRAKKMRIKVRRARLRCALARLHVEKLAESYYTRYGNFDGLSDSELSSESEFDSGTSEKI